MRKKKFIAMALVAMLSLSGLTGCSDKDKADISNKLNNKTTETTEKNNSKADNKTSESTTEDKKPDKSDSASKPSDNKKSDSNSGNTGSSKPDSSTSKPSKPAQSTEKPAETKPSQPAHQHTWVDHTATKTVHHDAVYEDVTIPAVTGLRIKCQGCGKYFSSLDELDTHGALVALGREPGDASNGGCGSYTSSEEVVITPAHTEHKLVKDAWDETQTYVDYQYCSGCGQHK